VKRIPPLGGAIGGFVVGLLLIVLWESAGPHTTVLVGQTLVLAITAIAAVWYAAQTRRMADATSAMAQANSKTVDLMKHQFDAAYTPHLRPYVRNPDGKSVVIALSNWRGTAAIHPGVYPEWSPPSKSADYGVLSKDIGPDLPIVDCATGEVIQVGDTWYCRVSLPPEDSGIVRVEYGDPPRRQPKDWALRSLRDMQGAWHFVPEPEE